MGGLKEEHEQKVNMHCNIHWIQPPPVSSPLVEDVEEVLIHLQ